MRTNREQIGGISGTRFFRVGVPEKVFRDSGGVFGGSLTFSPFVLLFVLALFCCPNVLPIAWGVPYFVTLYRGVVFVHHSCKKGTLLQNYHISRPFLRLTEAISVSKRNKNNNLPGKTPHKIQKCSFRGGTGEGHWGVWGNVYMYKHTEVNF
jgi:hypothetical protein